MKEKNAMRTLAIALLVALGAALETSTAAATPPQSAYDGNLNTRWANDGTLATAWIQYDLGSAQPIAAVKVRRLRDRDLCDRDVTRLADHATVTVSA